MDDEGTHGIPVGFCVWNDNYYICINNQHQYMGIKKFFSKLKDILPTLKKSKVMDWNNKNNLIVFGKNEEAKLNEKLYKQIDLIDIDDYDKNVNYIIDSRFIGYYVTIKVKKKL